MFTLLLACVPAEITIGDGTTIRTSAPGISEEVAESESSDCTIGAAWLIVQLDTNGAGHNDYVSEMDLTFSDGSTPTIHNGHGELPYTGQTIAFMTNVLSNQEVYVYGSAYLYGSDGSLLATLEPTLEDPWVAWNCPP